MSLSLQSPQTKCDKIPQPPVKDNETFYVVEGLAESFDPAELFDNADKFYKVMVPAVPKTGKTKRSSRGTPQRKGSKMPARHFTAMEDSGMNWCLRAYVDAGDGCTMALSNMLQDAVDAQKRAWEATQPGRSTVAATLRKHYLLTKGVAGFQNVNTSEQHGPSAPIVEHAAELWSKQQPDRAMGASKLESGTTQVAIIPLRLAALLTPSHQDASKPENPFKKEPFQTSASSSTVPSLNSTLASHSDSSEGLPRIGEGGNTNPAFLNSSSSTTLVHRNSYQATLPHTSGLVGSGRVASLPERHQDQHSDPAEPADAAERDKWHRTAASAIGLQPAVPCGNISMYSRVRNCRKSDLHDAMRAGSLQTKTELDAARAAYRQRLLDARLSMGTQNALAG
jgi:hypothetical protein